MYLISEQEVVWCSIIQTGCCTTITIQIKRSHWPDHWYSQYVVCWYPPPDATLGWWRRHVCHQLTSLSCTSCHCTTDDANYRSHTSSCTAPWSHCHACAVLSCTCTVICQSHCHACAALSCTCTFMSVQLSRHAQMFLALTAAIFEMWHTLSSVASSGRRNSLSLSSRSVRPGAEFSVYYVYGAMQVNCCNYRYWDCNDVFIMYVSSLCQVLCENKYHCVVCCCKRRCVVVLERCCV